MYFVVMFSFFVVVCFIFRDVVVSVIFFVFSIVGCGVFFVRIVIIVFFIIIVSVLVCVGCCVFVIGIVIVFVWVVDIIRGYVFVEERLNKYIKCEIKIRIYFLLYIIFFGL